MALGVQAPIHPNPTSQREDPLKAYPISPVRQQPLFAPPRLRGMRQKSSSSGIIKIVNRPPASRSRHYDENSDPSPGTERMYDMATWRMYDRIMTARKERESAAAAAAAAAPAAGGSAVPARDEPTKDRDPAEAHQPGMDRTTNPLSQPQAANHGNRDALLDVLRRAQSHVQDSIGASSVSEMDEIFVLDF